VGSGRGGGARDRRRGAGGFGTGGEASGGAGGDACALIVRQSEPTKITALASQCGASWYGRRDETCPVSTGGGTRRVQSVQEGGGGGGSRCGASCRPAREEVLRGGMAQRAAGAAGRLTASRRKSPRSDPCRAEAVSRWRRRRQREGSARRMRALARG